MLLYTSRSAAAFVAATVLIAGCSGPASNANAPAPQLPQSQAVSARPAHPTGAPWTRVGLGVPARGALRRPTGTVLVSETFANATTAKNTWFWKDNACLTAGTPSTPKGSIPACGANAPQDPPGGGALQLTVGSFYNEGFVGYHKPLPTANGLDVQYSLYAFNGSSPGADGSLVWFSAPGHPSVPGQEGGQLGYLIQKKGKTTGLKDAYLGVGFDEYGNFSVVVPGGPGFVPETVAIAGAESTGYHYLGGVTDGSGQPASLPFNLDDPAQPTRPSIAPTIDIQLTQAGQLSVAIDIHDGEGLVTYYSANIVGVAGQPAVPSSLYVGFTATTGGLYNTHQINNVTISTLQ